MGRYYFKILPFWISTGPEIFQKLMEKILIKLILKVLFATWMTNVYTPRMKIVTPVHY